MRWTVRLPLDLPSLNAYMRWHFRKQKKWRDLLAQYVCALGSPLPTFNTPVKVVVTRLYGFRKRAYDTDNAYASVKPLLDVLKSPKGRSRYGLSIIEEDNPSWCKLVVLQQKAEGKSTEILVEVLDPTEPDYI
jgi:hypothetical protein